jgi:hypothetical protein
MDVADDIMTHVDNSSLLEQVIIIFFSLHLGETLVLGLAMISFIIIPYTVLYHDF